MAKNKKGDGKKRVAFYMRVSSDEQKKEGLSLEAQKRRLEEYAEFKDWWVFKHYQDAGISGTSIKKRPKFRQMLRDAEEGKFSAILITRFDRAFRNTREALEVMDILKELSVDLVSLTEDVDTTTAMGKFFFTIISAFSELEAMKGGERVKDIFQDKFNQGLMIGKPPMGYKWSKTKKKFVIDPKKSSIVRKIFEMSSQGKKWKRICEEFKISPQSYYNILKNKAYIGKITYNGEERQGSHDPIISEELFRRVNNG